MACSSIVVFSDSLSHRGQPEGPRSVASGDRRLDTVDEANAAKVCSRRHLDRVFALGQRRDCWRATDRISHGVFLHLDIHCRLNKVDNVHRCCHFMTDNVDMLDRKERFLTTKFLDNLI